MAYKIMQKDENGVLREVVIRGQAVHGTEIDPGDIELKEFDDNTRSFVAIGSTGNPDRIEDVVDQRGWELDNFLKNPVGMWAHSYNTLPIFRVADLDIKSKSKKMLFKAVFDDHEFADNVYRSYKKGFMKGFSVGFIPITYELRDREEMTEEEQRRAGWFGGRHFKKQELLEISAAPIPMNPEALAGAKSLGIPVEWNTGMSANLGPNKTTLNDGSTWVPIDDISFFKDLSVIQLDGIKVVNGKTLEETDAGVVSKVAGYIFPKEMTEEQIVEWFIKRNVPEAKASAYVSDKENNYMELNILEDGKFALELAKSITEVVEEKTTEEEVVEEAVPVEDNNHVESTVDTTREKFVIIPESIEVDGDDLLVKVNLGDFRLNKEMLKKAGLEIKEDQLVTISNRQTLEDAANALVALLKDTKLQDEVEPEPEPAQDAQIDESEEFALLLTAAEELKADRNEEIEIDEEILREVLSGVLKENLGELVRSSVSKNLKHAIGDLE